METSKNREKYYRLTLNISTEVDLLIGDPTKLVPGRNASDLPFW
jgi:hypothetical protein